MTEGKPLTGDEKAALDKYTSDIKEQAATPAANIGLSQSEYQAKRAAAERPYTWKSGVSEKVFSIMSHARSKAIMTEGMVERLHEKRFQELDRKKRGLNYLRGAVAFIGIAATIYICYDMIYPRWKIRNDRNERLKRRYNEIFVPSMERLLADQKKLKAYEEQGMTPQDAKARLFAEQEELKAKASAASTAPNASASLMPTVSSPEMFGPLPSPK